MPDNFKEWLFDEIERKKKNSNLSDLFKIWEEKVYSDEVFKTIIVRNNSPTQSSVHVGKHPDSYSGPILDLRSLYPKDVDAFRSLRYCSECGGLLTDGHVCKSADFMEVDEGTVKLDGYLIDIMMIKKGRDIEEILKDPRALPIDDED